MTVRAVLAGAALVGAGVTLCGCGGTATTAAPTPAPTPAPGPVQIAFNSHFNSFATGVTAGAEGDELEAALTTFMLDFDAESSVAVFNDACDGKNEANTQIQGYTLYKTPETIKAFFKAQILQLKSLDNLDAVGPLNGNPVLKEGNKPEGNVFLTWRTTLTGADEIKYATDSMSWKITDGVAKIWKQNEVTTEPGKACGDAVDHTAAACAADSATPVCTGWKNHFDAFGEGANAKGVDATLDAALTKIMLDYTADSLVQVFDNRVKAYETFQGLEPIKGMFRQLFKDIDAAKSEEVENPIGLVVKVLEVDETVNGVFLVWESLSHPKATDTFVFNDDGKIIRQNIVVKTKDPAAEVNVMV